MTGFPALSTRRLRLREIVPADADALFSIYSDATAMRWFGSDPMTERVQARQLIDIYAEWRRGPAPGTRWGIVVHETGMLVGTVGLFRWNRSWRNCVLGYELGRDAWGHGYMTEALHAVLEYGFNVMALHRVQAEIHPDNLASKKLVERVGFRKEGTHRQQGYWGGQYHDLECYSLLEGELTVHTGKP